MLEPRRRAACARTVRIDLAHRVESSSDPIEFSPTRDMPAEGASLKLGIS